MECLHWAAHIYPTTLLSPSSSSRTPANKTHGLFRVLTDKLSNREKKHTQSNLEYFRAANIIIQRQFLFDDKHLVQK